MNTQYIVTLHAIISCASWFVVGIGGLYAVFSPKVRDTTAERLALSCISIFAFATSVRVVRQGWVSEGGMMLSAAMACYVIVIIYKHWNNKRHALPKDKTQPMPLEPTWRQDVHL